MKEIARKASVIRGNKQADVRLSWKTFRQLHPPSKPIKQNGEEILEKVQMFEKTLWGAYQSFLLGTSNENFLVVVMAFEFLIILLRPPFMSDEIRKVLIIENHFSQRTRESLSANSLSENCRNKFSPINWSKLNSFRFLLCAYNKL